jgi:hypothetical protein
VRTIASRPTGRTVRPLTDDAARTRAGISLDRRVVMARTREAGRVERSIRHLVRRRPARLREFTIQHDKHD